MAKRYKIDQSIKDSIKYYIPFCIYCYSDNNLAIEHIYPVVLGGGNEYENLSVASQKCNSKKHDKTIKDFFLKVFEERDLVYIKFLKYLNELRKNITIPKDYLTNKLLKSREQHSYLTQIICSILSCNDLKYNAAKIQSLKK